MRRGGDDLRVGDGRGMDAAGNESGEVGHVDDEDRAGLVGDVAHAGKVEEARVGATAADDDFGLLADGDLFEEVVVDGFGVFSHAV